MPKARPISQQRKRRVRVSRSAPFPVPIETVTGESASSGNWIYYVATLEDCGVVVKHSGDMDFLYKMGFFGKGSMSRGQPQWAEHWRVVTLPRQQAHISGQQSMLRAKVTSRRRYMTHLEWQLLTQGDSTGLAKLQEDQQYIVTEDMRDSSSDKHPDQNSQELLQSEAVETKTGINAVEFSENAAADVDMKSPHRQPDWEEEEGEEDFWGVEETSSMKKFVEASWDSTAKGDEDFWGTETVSVSDSKQSHSSASGSWDVLDVNKSRTSPEPPGLSSESNEMTKRGRLNHDDERNRRLTDSAKVVENAVSEHLLSSHSTVKNLHGDALSLSGGSHNASSIMTTSGSKTAEGKAAETSAVPSHSENTTGTHNENTPSTQSASDRSTDDANTNCNRNLENSDSVMFCDGNENSHSKHNEKAACSPDSGIVWSQFCEGGDDITVANGNTLFVVPDSDEEEPVGDGTERVCRMKTRWRPVLKQDPFPVKENLHLSYEEAYFLSYGLGCLTVLDSQQIPMDLEHMWREFCQRQPSFLPNYVAYHYYRSKNWVPKTGLKFGCTFLLYKDGPPFYHGSYSVVVKFVDTEGKPVEGFGEQRQFSWTSLAGLKRITEHVGKELMFCYVIKPKDLTVEEMLSPKCVPHFQVKEMLVSRWVSSQEREGKALEEMP